MFRYKSVVATSVAEFELVKKLYSNVANSFMVYITKHV